MLDPIPTKRVFRQTGSRLGRSLPLLLVLLAAACGDDGPSANQNVNHGSCPEGHQTDGPACVPIFDDPADCPGPNEMPVLGGGCRAVGVTRCATGFVTDGTGGCDPLLPDHVCPPGTMEMIGQTECQPVGVTECATGFVTDGEGGCDAIVPGGACPAGSIAVIGSDACQPLGDCGPEGSPWGLIEADGTTVYVDATADATGADGSAATPFPTITAALAVVAPGGQVAIAAGEYMESVMLESPVRLEGRCAARVTLRGSVDGAALSIAAGASGSSVRGITLTGSGAGLLVSGAEQLAIADLEVRETGSYGIAMWDAIDARLRDVKVTDCATIGIGLIHTSATVERVVVEGTLSHPESDTWGLGITAECADPERCGSVTIDRSVVIGNRYAGIRSLGVDTTIRASVVRGTLPQGSDLSLGVGVLAECNTETGACGTLHVDRSLVLANRGAGIHALGVAVTVVSTVVRDSLPLEVEKTNGVGINVECLAGAGGCAPLEVEDCLVAGSHMAGIGSRGVDATIRSSIVRDTLPQESDGSLGQGIAAVCGAGAGSCPRVTVLESLVSGNHSMGIGTTGGALTVRSSLIRDTLPSDTAGRGIYVSNFPGTGLVGSLVMEGSIVADNREIGVHAVGADAIIRASLVRDTRSREDDATLGSGIFSECLPDGSACGALEVDGSAVVRSRGFGIASLGAETHIRASSIHGTLPLDSDGTAGVGIVASCDQLSGRCGSLVVEESSIAANHWAAILAQGVDATVRASVMRDTLAEESSLDSGFGLHALCELSTGICGTLLLEDSLVTRNRESGLLLAGVAATIRGSAIVDTLAQDLHQAFGRGIGAQCLPDLGICGSLVMEASLVAHNENAGIFVYGVPTELRSVAVIDTVSNSEGEWAGQYGQGIWALCVEETGDCGTLAMDNCRLATSRGAGLALEGVSGYIAGSVVETVRPQSLDDRYGYGIQVGGREGDPLSSFHVRACRIRDATLAGVLYVRSQGTLSGSVVTGGEYCVAMNEGSAPTIASDNQLSCSVESDPEWVSLYPSPAPPPATPMMLSKP